MKIKNIYKIKIEKIKQGEIYSFKRSGYFIKHCHFLIDTQILNRLNRNTHTTVKHFTVTNFDILLYEIFN